MLQETNNHFQNIVSKTTNAEFLKKNLIYKPGDIGSFCQIL